MYISIKIQRNASYHWDNLPSPPPLGTHQRLQDFQEQKSPRLLYVVLVGIKILSLMENCVTSLNCWAQRPRDKCTLTMPRSAAGQWPHSQIWKLRLKVAASIVRSLARAAGTPHAAPEDQSWGWHIVCARVPGGGFPCCLLKPLSILLFSDYQQGEQWKGSGLTQC